MLQYSNLNSVIDSKDHSKNGTILKNLISKESQMKWHKFVTIILFFFVGSISFTFAQQIEWALKNVKGSEPFYEGIACFKEDDKWGAIDRSGQVVIEPQFTRSFEFNDGFAVVKKFKYLGNRNWELNEGIINRNGTFILEPEYEFIRKKEEAEGLYEVENRDGKLGLFYNNRLVIPPVYDKKTFNYILWTSNFPFVSTGENYINILNGKLYKYVSKVDDLFETKSKDGVVSYHTKDGDEFDPIALRVSSKGIILFQINPHGQSKKYGFKNNSTGEVVCPPIYSYVHIPLFINDVMIVEFTDSNFKSSYAMIDAYGKEAIKPNYYHIRRLNEYVVVATTSDKKYNVLYSIMGKQLSPPIYHIVSVIGRSGCIRAITDFGKENVEYTLYSANGEKLLTGYKYISTETDGMVRASKRINKNKEQWGFINCETMQEINPQYDKVDDFSNGFARVSKNGKNFFIDKTGKTILTEDNNIKFGDKVSEGLLFAKNEKTGENGYIFVNPYVSNQKTFSNITVKDAVVNQWIEEGFIDKTINNWLEEGYKSFEKKKYAVAKEYYYKAMMSAPTNVNAIIGYGACLANMDYYEEAIECYNIALDIEPDNKMALNNIEISHKNMQKREMEQQNTGNRSSTFWDALVTFGNVLYNVGSAINSTNSFSGGSYSEGSSGGCNCANLQSLYTSAKRKRDGATDTYAYSGAKEKVGVDNSAGNAGVKSSSGQLMKAAEQTMARLQRDAAKCGCVLK